MQQLLNYRNNVLHLFNDNASNSPVIGEIVPIYDKDLLLTPTNLGEMYEVYRYRIKASGSGGAGLGSPWYSILKLLEPHKYYYGNLLGCDVWPFGSLDVLVSGIFYPIIYTVPQSLYSTYLPTQRENLHS